MGRTISISMEFDLYFTPHTKKYLQVKKNLNINNKTIEFLEDIIRAYICDLGTAKIF